MFYIMFVIYVYMIRVQYNDLEFYLRYLFYLFYVVVMVLIIDICLSVVIFWLEKVLYMSY